MGTHAALVNRCAWMHSAYPFAEDEICCAKTAITFVDSVWEIFGPLLEGVPLVMLDDDVARDSYALVKSMEQHSITRIVVVPVLLAAMLDLSLIHI